MFFCCSNKTKSSSPPPPPPPPYEYTEINKMVMDIEKNDTISDVRNPTIKIIPGNNTKYPDYPMYTVVEYKNLPSILDYEYYHNFVMNGHYAIGSRVKNRPECSYSYDKNIPNGIYECLGATFFSSIGQKQIWRLIYPEPINYIPHKG